MSGIHARLAAASGAGAAGAALLMFSQRVPGTVPAVLLLAVAARASGAACALAGSPMVRAAAHETLARQAAFVPVWIGIVAAGSLRAGTTVIGDVAGAHAVAGIGLVRGPIATVVGLWVCALAAAIAVGGSGMLPPAGHGAQRPAASGRLDVVGAATQIGLIVALVAGPQVRTGRDAIAWVACSVGIGLWAWFGRGVATVRTAPWIASALSLGGLVLVVLGGRP